jgi:hypothetical protein
VFDEETKMIGCLLFGAGFLMMARMIHRHHHGWHYGRWSPYGPGLRRWGGPRGWHGYGCTPANDDGFGGDDEFYGGGGGGFEPGPRFMRGGLGRGFGKGFLARAIADRLEATPAQEKVIRDAAEEFHESVSKLKGEGKQTRADVAAAFRKSHFDEVFFGELFARHDTALTDLRKAFVGLGARIHDALDDKQRARLAEMIESGPSAFRARPRARGWGYV